MDANIIIPLYVAGALAGMYLAQARGYWWPIGLAFGLVIGPFAPAAMLILPNRKRRSTARHR